jgi:hypothetical protein
VESVRRTVKTCSWLIAGAVVSLLIGSSCTSVQYQADRLDRQIGKATQEEIFIVFGPPDETKELPGGETEWVYRYKHTSGPGTGVMGTSTCWKNILRFDKTNVLVEQRKEPC